MSTGAAAHGGRGGSSGGGTAASAPRAVETHTAVLFFAGDRVYKAKKPLDLGFLDHTSLAARRAACEREVELNRRTAPDVYIGVADLVGPDDTAWEHLVVMRRMPEDRSLTRCLVAGEDVGDALGQIARALVALHADGAVDDPDRDHGSIDAVRRNWMQSFEQLHALEGADFDAATESRIETLVGRYLAGRGDLFAQRVADGWIRDGHGDLRADDIYLLPDGPRILDCIEFGDRYRIADALSDAAFLAMDLERLGHAELASLFLSTYRAMAAGRWPPSLAHHYIAYRAHIRAKVRALRQVQLGLPSDPGIDIRLELAHQHLESAQVRLVLVGGLPGTGKSTVADALADEIDAIVLRTDDVRQRLIPDEGPERDRYAPDAVRAVYDQALQEAEILLRRGEHVILDATWNDADLRARARALGAGTSSAVTELRCTAPADVAARRIEDRRRGAVDPSEATPAVATAMAGRFASWPEASTLDTLAPLAEATATALDALGWRRPSDRQGRTARDR